MSQAIDAVGYYFLRLLAFLIGALPLVWSLRIARCLGVLVYLFDKRRYVAYANIRAAFPTKFSPAEVRRIVLRNYCHLAENLFEMLSFHKISRNVADRFILMEDKERYEEMISGKKGTIFLSGHFGNWELAHVWSGIQGNPMSVLVKEQKHSRLNQFLDRVRSTNGSMPIQTNEKGLRQLVRALKQGELVGALGDQGGGRDGLVAPLFGRLTTVPTGLLNLARRLQVQVVPSFAVRQKGPYHRLYLSPPLKLADTGNETSDEIYNARLFLEQLEDYTARYPDQWLWLHKRWKYCFTKRILILEDEKQGHATQARALGREFSDLTAWQEKKYEYEFYHVPIRFRNKFTQKAFFVLGFLLLPFAQSRLYVLKWFLTKDSYTALKDRHADIVVSSGSALLPVCLWLREEFRAKTMISMKPPLPYQWCKFDLLVIPAHDRINRSQHNAVSVSVVPNIADPNLIQESTLLLRRMIQLENKQAASVMIGGKSKQFDLDIKKLRSFLQDLIIWAQAQRVDLLVTTSRRTDHATDQMIKNIFSNVPECKLLVIANEKNIDRVTYGMLGLSQYSFITEESVSMISEAVAAGHRPVLIRCGNGKLSEKHSRFCRALVSERLAVNSEMVNWQSEISGKETNSFNSKLSAEKQNLKTAVAKLL